jgi:hypothetical protein
MFFVVDTSFLSKLKITGWEGKNNRVFPKVTYFGISPQIFEIQAF